MPNYNPNTGIPFGYISANALDPDLVNDLLDGSGVTDFVDHSYAAFNKEAIAEWKRNHKPEDDSLVDDDEYLLDGELQVLTDDEIWDEIDYDIKVNFYPDEPQVEGTKDNVHYASSWPGGALNFFIFQSPNITNSARQCSPCVPGAGNLDTLDGDYQCYDVPQDWRKSDED